MNGWVVRPERPENDEPLTAPMPQAEAIRWANKKQKNWSLPLVVRPDESGTVAVSRKFLSRVVYEAGTGDDTMSWDYAATAEVYIRRLGVPAQE